MELPPKRLTTPALTITDAETATSPRDVAATSHEATAPESEFVPELVADGDATINDAMERSHTTAPTRQELLQRAAALQGMRMTWASTTHASDPVLASKRHPRVVERRARLRTLVAVALGICFVFCLAAMALSAAGSLSYGASNTSPTNVSTIKTTPAIAIVPIEMLELKTRTKIQTTAVRRYKAGKHR